MQELDWGSRDERWAGISSDTITIDGVDIHVLRAEPSTVTAHDPTPVHPGDLPILLVHGLGGAATNWLEVMADLARNVPVVAVDLPGFGDTRPPTPRATHMRIQVRFLRRVLDTLGWDRAEVHGNSMGGLLSIMLAGAHPSRVARLVLVSPAYPPGRAVLGTMAPEVSTRFLPFAASRTLGRGLLRRLYRDSTPQQVFRGTEAIVMADGGHMRPAMQRVGREHAAAGMQRDWRLDGLAQATRDLLVTMFARPRTVTAAADAITADILLLWGDSDQLVGQVSVDALTTRRGDITRHDLASVGHVPMIEVPDRYVELVANWRDTMRAGHDTPTT